MSKIILLSCLFAASTSAGNINKRSENIYTLGYRVTAFMWDAELQKPIPTSKDVLDHIHHAFDLCQDASGGGIRFVFSGFGNDAYDGYNQIPYDGSIWPLYQSW